MALVISSKFIASFVAALLLLFLPMPVELRLALVGILPIWVEVSVTKLTQVEASLERRPRVKALDMLADAVAFVIVPPLCFAHEFHSHGAFAAIGGRERDMLYLAALVFAICGIYRLARFYRRGLLRRKYFSGLPVTYTGYIWVLAAFCIDYGVSVLAFLLLLLISFAMISQRIKIRRTLLKSERTARQAQTSKSPESQ